MHTETVDVITIDGPSSSGKGTVARLLAARLGWRYLDSGALYRAVAVAALAKGVSLDAEDRLADIAKALDIEFRDSDGDQHVFLEDRCIDTEIRAETTGDAASQVARHAAVRKALLGRQRQFAELPGLVADGRDMGTVVFPHASHKFYLTASAEERAMRRHKQLNEKGIGVSLPALAKDIAERDLRDSSRATAPLRPADDAVTIDSTQLSAVEVVTKILSRLADAGIVVAG